MSVTTRRESVGAIRIDDYSAARVPLEDILRHARLDLQTALELGRQFCNQNAPVFRDFGCEAVVSSHAGKVAIQLRSSDYVGAVTLNSPLDTRSEIGLIIRPRFSWAGTGVMLGMMGWRVVPDVYRAPPLPSSDRQVPRWVLSSIVLARLAPLIQTMHRGFNAETILTTHPRGTID